MRKILITACISILLMSCKSSVELVKEDLKTPKHGNFTCEDNSNGSFKLCMTDVENDEDPETLIKFALIDSKKEEVIYQNSVIGGYVKWKNDAEIEFYDTPGIVQESTDQQKFIKVYNIQERRIIRKGKQNQ